MILVILQHGYNVTDPEDKTVSNADEPSSENDDYLMEAQQDNHETAQSHQVRKNLNWLQNSDRGRPDH